MQREGHDIDVAAHEKDILSVHGEEISGTGGYGG